MQKHEEYASKIINQLSEMFDDENNDNHIDLATVDGTALIHALATMAPAFIYNKIKAEDGDTDFLSFNHIANTLCFQYCRGEVNGVTTK